MSEKHDDNGNFKNEKKKELYDALAPCRVNPGNTGLFSDLDGTLSAIAPSPSMAGITPEMRVVLNRLAGTYEAVAIVTGRDAANAKKMVELDSLIYIGNHGLERMENTSLKLLPEAEKYLDIAQTAFAELTAALNESGVLIEKKRLGVAVHFRAAENKDEVRKRIERIASSIASRYPLKVTDGRNVVELKPALDYNKGYAVRTLAYEKALNCVLYIGDDVTDIDAFKELKRMRADKAIHALSVAVASRESDPEVCRQADYVIEGVADVQSLLEWLAKV